MFRNKNRNCTMFLIGGWGRWLGGVGGGGGAGKERRHLILLQNQTSSFCFSFVKGNGNAKDIVNNKKRDVLCSTILSW